MTADNIKSAAWALLGVLLILFTLSQDDSYEVRTGSTRPSAFVDFVHEFLDLH